MTVALMRIVTSAVWHQDVVLPPAPALIRLDELLPQPGQTRRVSVAEHELSDGQLHLLWCPPYSEENGWDEQPSEIASSHIVTGHVRRRSASTSERPGARQVACDIAIEGRTPLLEAVRSPTPAAPPARAPAATAGAPTVPAPPTSGRSVLWKNVRWCATAAIHEFTYVSALSGEAHVELLVQRRGPTLAVLYEQSWVDGWSDGTIGFRALDDDLSQAIARHLDHAVTLRDRAPAYFE
jgi:hypothetical protein